MKKIVVSLILGSMWVQSAHAYTYQFTNLTGVPVDIRITAVGGNDQRRHVLDKGTVTFKTGAACLYSISVDTKDFWGTTGPGWTGNTNDDKTLVDKSFYTIRSTGFSLLCAGLAGKFYLTNAGKLAFMEGDFKSKTVNEPVLATEVMGG